MLSRLLIQRLLIPYLALIVLLIGAAAAFVAAWSASSQRLPDASPLLWFLLGCAVVGIAAGIFIIILYARHQAKEVADAVAPLNVPQSKNPSNLTALLGSTTSRLGELQAQASKDKAHLLTILTGMSDGLIAIDSTQRLTLVNKAAENLLGVPLAGVQGKPLYEFVTIGPLLKAIHEVLLTGQQKTIQIGPIESRYLEITLCRLSKADGAGGAVIVIHDVTQSRRYEELRKEFVANVSHELRTPLTVIRGFVETLLDGAIDDRNRAMQYLQTIDRHSGQLANLVNDLLDLSRLDSGVDASPDQMIAIAPLVQHVVEMAQPTADKKHQGLALQIADNLPPIPGNADYLHRALTNLVDNAIKYTPEQGQITISARQLDRQLLIDVSDTGIGIPADDLPHIFERFYRVDRSRSREMGGTGLGLSIVKHVVQNHGGSVDVSSTPGAGSKFTIYLPLSPAIRQQA